MKIWKESFDLSSFVESDSEIDVVDEKLDLEDLTSETENEESPTHREDEGWSTPCKGKIDY